MDNKFAMSIGQTFRYDQIKEHSFKKFAKDMNVRPKLLASLINEVCETVINELDGLIAEHEKNYGEAKIYKELNKIKYHSVARFFPIKAKELKAAVGF